jgi:hypothetical protein
MLHFFIFEELLFEVACTKSLNQIKFAQNISKFVKIYLQHKSKLYVSPDLNLKVLVPVQLIAGCIYRKICNGFSLKLPQFSRSDLKFHVSIFQFNWLCEKSASDETALNQLV